MPRATKAALYTPTHVKTQAPVTPSSGAVPATFTDDKLSVSRDDDVVSLLAMLLVQLSQVFGVHDVRVSLATFKSPAATSK